MGIITYFLPYLFLFGAMFRLQRDPASPDVIRVPGGKPIAVLLSGVGFTTASLTIAFSLIPGPDEANPPLAIFKVVGGTAVLIAVGALLYRLNATKSRSAAI
jgi:hypothetical protein